MYVWRVMTDNRDYDSTVTQESCRETSSRLQTGSVKNFVTVKLLSGALAATAFLRRRRIG